jgi:hypothetical protein
MVAIEPLLALYPGQCAHGDRIKVGEAIESSPSYSPHDDAYVPWQHVQCPEATADRDDREALARPRCAVCGLNHPGEC